MSDRKLLHVNKKGRPVSQCPHCRSLRKSRSQHVKCECHDKSHAKEDCPHLKDLQEAPTGTCDCARRDCLALTGSQARRRTYAAAVMAHGVPAPSRKNPSSRACRKI